MTNSSQLSGMQLLALVFPALFVTSCGVSFPPAQDATTSKPLGSNEVQSVTRGSNGEFIIQCSKPSYGDWTETYPHGPLNLENTCNTPPPVEECIPQNSALTRVIIRDASDVEKAKHYVCMLDGLKIEMTNGEVNLPALRVIQGGSYRIEISAKNGFPASDRLAVRLPNLKDIKILDSFGWSGSVYISNSSLQVFEAPKLQSAVYIFVHGNSHLESLKLPSLTTGSIHIGYNENLRELKFPSLGSTESGGISLHGNRSLQSFEAPRLKNAKSLELTNINSLKTFRLPALETIECSALLDLSSPDFETLSLPALKNIKGSSEVHGCRGDLEIKSSLISPADELPLKNIHLNSLETVAGKITLDGLGIEEFKLPFLSSTSKLEIMHLPSLRKIRLPAMISGEVNLQFNKALTDLEIPSLRNTARIHIFGTGLKQFSAPQLSTAGLLSIEYNEELKTLHAPQLEDISMALSVVGNGVTDINMPSLKQIREKEDEVWYRGRALDISMNSTLQKFDLSKLTVIGGNTRLNPLPFPLPALKQVSGSLEYTDLIGATENPFPVLEKIGTNQLIRNPEGSIFTTQKTAFKLPNLRESNSLTIDSIDGSFDILPLLERVDGRLSIAVSQQNSSGRMEFPLLKTVKQSLSVYEQSTGSGTSPAHISFPVLSDVSWLRILRTTSLETVEAPLLNRIASHSQLRFIQSGLEVINNTSLKSLNLGNFEAADALAPQILEIKNNGQLNDCGWRSMMEYVLKNTPASADPAPQYEISDNAAVTCAP